LNNPSSQGPLILLANGQVLTVGTGSAELYNPATGNWTVTASTATPRTGHTATLLPNSEVLVAGGYLGNGIYTATAELYNPPSGQWRPTGNMTVPRDLHSATLLQNGKVLVAGGTNADNGLSSGNTAELYDPSTGTWKATGSMHNYHPLGLITLRNGKALKVDASGGSGNGELYDPSTEQWMLLTAPMY
jgi:hypothetical protein